MNCLLHNTPMLERVRLKQVSQKINNSCVDVYQRHPVTNEASSLSDKIY
jgi:hypothetical protein